MYMRNALLRFTPRRPVMTKTSFRDEELLADVIARLIGDVRHVAVGNASPIPATAALLARERGKGRPYVSLLQSRKHNFFTDGAVNCSIARAKAASTYSFFPAGKSTVRATSTL